MITMKPIDEFDVIASLNQGRFGGEVEGYIMMEGPKYLGYALFRIEDGVTTVLECDIADFGQLDGIVRACVAAGDNRGAGRFAVNGEDAGLAAWWSRYCRDLEDPAPVERIFSHC